MTDPTPTPAPTDEALAHAAAGGDRDALATLLRRHQRFLYNVAFRMLHRPEDAEDATQESLLKIATRLASFRGESGFRTWAYRIAVNHLLDVRRSRPETVVTGFGCYQAYLDAAPDADPPDPAAQPDAQLLVEEARRSCTLGMLLCLDRPQRLAYVLGEILEVGDEVAAEVLELSRDAFRQRLARAREQLHGFLRGHCGLVDPANACRCARKTRAFVRDGIVDPGRLVFTRARTAAAAQAVPAVRAALGPDGLAAALYRAHPQYEPEDLAARVREAIEAGPLRAVLQA